ncbi:hypothetical protein GEO21_04905 [Sphingobacterium faecium]|uniref:hypothetical protein n=1 Tax=Sphingobacterium faecium TaxID=34087 RepID=UPI001291638D|nr:hypothetical protein [Sphingobacterium faecium]MQP26858.1 hypothetical protein [Sphingobacterium faecium]
MEQSNFIESLLKDSIFKELLEESTQFPFHKHKDIFQEVYDNIYELTAINIGRFHFEKGHLNVSNSTSLSFRSPEAIIKLVTKDLVFYQNPYESFGKNVNFIALPANEDGSVEVRGIVGKYYSLDKELDIKIKIYGGIVCYISILVFKV